MQRENHNPAFIYPPLIDDCKKHRMASRIFKGTSEENYDFNQCQCCGRSIGDQKVSIPFCYDPVKELIYLGPGVPLMFIFARMSMIFLTIFTLLFSIYAMVTNLQGVSCLNNANCDSSIFLRLSLANKITNNSEINVQNYLLLAYIFLLVFLMQFMVYTMRKANHDADELINSPSDYSLLVSQLPPGTTDKDLLQMVHQERAYLDDCVKRDTSNLAIKEIIMSVELSEYLKEMQEEEQSFLERKKKDADFNYQFKFMPKPNTNSTFAIIIFTKQDSKGVFDVPVSCYTGIRNCLCNLCLKYTHFRVKDRMVVCQRAPEPDDILWQNADKPRSAIIRNKIISFIVSMCLLTLGGYIQYILQIQKKSLVNQTIISFYNILSSISIVVFNFIISQFMVFMTAREGNCTQTHSNVSLLIKISLLQFFNAGIFYTFARIAAEQIDNFNIQGNQSYQLTLFMTINAVGTTTANIIITKLQFPTCIQRYLFLKGWLKYNQKQANKLFEAPEILFPLKYTFLIRTIWLACFYASFVPVVVPISVVGIIYFYFSEVYLFRNNYALPFMVSKQLVDTAIWLLRYTGIITLSGGFIVVFYISYRLKANFTAVEGIPFILGLIISVALIFLPNKRISKRLFNIQSTQATAPTYDEAYKQFTVTYKSTNPLSTHDEKMKRGEVMVSNFLRIFEMKSKIGGQSKVTANRERLMENGNPFGKLMV